MVRSRPSMEHDNEYFQRDSAQHPSDAELINYTDGSLPEPQQEEVQGHLVQCDMCLELLKDLRDFCDGQRPAEQTISEDISTEWKGLWNRITEESLIQLQDQIPEKSRRPHLST